MSKMKLTFLSIFFLATFNCDFVASDVSREAQLLTLKWAPVIWLHPDEKFFPVSPEFVINNMEVFLNLKSLGYSLIFLLSFLEKGMKFDFDSGSQKHVIESILSLILSLDRSN